MSNNNNLFQRVHSKKTKSGFTLLETVLAVALLLIVTVFVYQGFMTTLHYSSNTAIYERSASDNEATIKSAIGQGIDPVVLRNHTGFWRGLYIDDPTTSSSENRVISVFFFHRGEMLPLVNTPHSGDFTESSIVPAVERYGFVFIDRPCQVSGCDGNIRWYEDSDGNIQEMCSNPECPGTNP